MDTLCRNPSLGLATKTRDCKVTGQEEPRSHKHAPKNTRECEGIDPHTPKGTPTLGVGVSVNSQIFKKRFQKSKPIALKSYLYQWKDIET
jgi:hypothetical protein